MLTPSRQWSTATYQMDRSRSPSQPNSSPPGIAANVSLSGRPKWAVTDSAAWIRLAVA